MNKAEIFLASALIALSMPCMARDQSWLGAYAGPNIPGYEITKAGPYPIYSGSEGGPTEDHSPAKMIDHIIQNCKSGGGVALVNIKVALALGQVSYREHGSFSVVDPAKAVLAYGDCVHEVELIKRKAK